MISTGIASMRFGASVAFGRPFSMSALAAIAASVSAAAAEFGTGAGGDDLLMSLDPDTQRMVQARRLRAQARRAARETDFYKRRLDGLDLAEAKSLEQLIEVLPTTSKAELQHDPRAFVRQRARPVHRNSTTGTTGPATTVWFSEREQYLIGVLTALSLSTDGLLTPGDRVLGATSSRARLGMHGLTFAAQTIGASAHACGLLPPAEALELLCDDRTSPAPNVLATYPSYLGALITEAVSQGRRPDEFGLRSVLLGGEVLTEGLRERAHEALGEVSLLENYGMTELVPFGASLCEDGHLHYEPTVGLLEVLDLDTASRPIGPGETGVIVATPLPPFRETTVLLRYVTEDVVTTLPEPARCSRAHLPATSRPLGKRSSGVRHDSGWLFGRAVREALEALRLVPLPARFRMQPRGTGVAVEVVTERDGRDAREQVSTALERAGVSLRALRLVDRADGLSGPAAMRSDLVETTMRSVGAAERRPAVGVAS